MVPAIQEKGNDVDPYYSSIYMCDKNGAKITLNQHDMEKAYIIQDGDKTPCYESSDLPQCKNKIQDYQPNCKKNQDCCSNICSIGEYNSTCCPLFTKPDGNGGCS